MTCGADIRPGSARSPRISLASPRIRVAPSLLSADFSRLEAELSAIETAGAQILHLDVMDGHFVPNISFGVPVIASLRKCTGLFFDVHLMISEPQTHAQAFVDAGCDHLTFHIEAVDEPAAVVDHIRRLGVSVGVSLNPTTPVSTIEGILEALDLVLVMSVWPGFSGQTFIRGVLTKVEELRARIGEHQRLEIDGGIDPETIGLAARAGADTFVAGSAIFGSPEPPRAFAELQRLALGAAEGCTHG